MFEKKRGTRFLASVMALVMLLSLAPVGALATEGEGQPAENQTVTQPANGVDQKPVETGTANTNEETTPPPANEGIAVLPANNNNAPVALPETPVIVKPTEVLDPASGMDSDTSKDNGIAEYGSNDYIARTVKVAVYATDGYPENSPVNEDIADLLGIPCKQEDGYYPIGVIELDKSLLHETGPCITSEEDWEAVKQAIGEIKTDKLKNSYVDGNVGNVYGSENKDNKIKENLDKVQPDLNGTAGSKKTALFFWGKNNPSKNIKGNYEYHLDLRFASVCLTYKGVKEDDMNNSFDLGERVYLKDTIILKPGESKDFYLEGIPADYQIEGYYSDKSLQNEYNFYQKAETSATIYVKLVRKPVTITYDLNDGTSAEYPNKASVVFENQIVKTSLPTINDPVREGYTFVGWEKDGRVYSKSDLDIQQVTGDATYTAQWSINKHKVTYSDGVNNTVFSEQVTDNVEYGANIPQFNDNTKLTRQGYTFTGWVCDVENIDTNSAMPDRDVTFTAQWKAETVNARYFINLGGRDASRPDGKGTFTDGIEISEAINLQNFNDAKQPGYGNNGYVYNKDGVNANLLNQKPSEKQINDALTAKLANDQTKLASMLLGEDGREVVWYHVSDCSDGYHVDGYIKNVAIKIIYNPNEGSFGTTVEVDSSGNHNVDGISGTTHDIISETPTRNGYTFTGWKLDGNDTLYKNGDSITPTGDVTLVAQWSSNTETLTYHENFGETEHTYTISVDRDSTQTIYSYETVRNLSGVFGQNTGSLFDGWTVSKERGSKETTYRDGDSIEMSSSIDLYAQWKKARVPKVAYIINQHFINEKNQEITTLANSQYKSAKQGTVLGTLITDTLKENKTDSENNVYVYIADKTTFKVGTTKVESIATLSSKDTVIDLYYYLDNWKDADETTDSTDKDGETGGDGIPDCYQVLVKYQSGDLRKGKIADTARTQEVLTIRVDKQLVNKGTVQANGSTAEVTGSRCYFSNWTNDDNQQIANSATLDKQTIQNAEGGRTYTFTANFDRSSGGGSGGSNRPKPPVVEIPDDVPTGLNGKDHYAYIIGYGNNDVRPQNNITRAEVATIFFRLLTDETREANMTKSNSYNDVKDGDWFCCAVSTLSKMGIIKGYEDGSFKPNDPISRAEFAAIAARFDPDGDKTPATFADVTSHWAKDEISIAANHGWIKGYEDGSFKPDQKITRAETMTLVNRVLNRLPETKDDLHKDMKTWVDNMDETAWYYLAVQEATNSHYFKNKTGTKFEQWTDLRDTRDWSELEK